MAESYPARVDEAKLRFLFGAVPDGVELRDEDERAALLSIDRPGGGVGPSLTSLRIVIANQVLDGEPRQTWETAQRLLDRGMGRHEVMDQLTAALFPFVEQVLSDEVPFDPVAYVDALARLPGPGAVAVLQTYVDVVRQYVAIDADELDGVLAVRLGLDPDDPDTVDLLADAEDALMDDPGAPVTMLPDDVVVHVPALTAGATLTHRLSPAEHAENYLELDTDLAGFLRCPEPRVAAGPLDVDDPDDGLGEISWSGPLDWLAELPLDALVAVRAGKDGDVTISVLDAEPVAPPEVVAHLRAVYDAAVGQSGQPVSAEDLVLGMLYRDRSTFAHARPPLTELAAAAGLERRGHDFAHDASVWEAAEQVGRRLRLLARLGAVNRVSAAVTAVGLLRDQADDPKVLRRALDLLGDPDVLGAVTEELLGEDDDPERVAALVALADRLVTAAGRSPRAAVARWVAAVAAERDSRVLDAESHLRAAGREGDRWSFTEDRLAWYEADRGDAAAALQRWQAIGVPADDPDVAAVRPFAVVASPELGRNQLCWCGSGRKFKQCHLGRPAEVPLAERVGWLCRKAVAYLERRGGAAQRDVQEFAELVSDDLDEALDNPLTLDVVLHEGGWFERFLAERGPLLPADEALLAASWVLVERTVYEVVEVRPGTGATVRDLRTGDRTDVTERAFSQVVTVGVRVCARAVPDGVGHQFVGGVLSVAPGRERELLEVLDRRDGETLLAWAALSTAPPLLTSGDDDQPVDAASPVPIGPVAVVEIQDRFERRWCDEEVPALDELTPRQAAGDPTRRAEVERLIASFPEIETATGAFGLRPARLRELLGLPAPDQRSQAVGPA